MKEKANEERVTEIENLPFIPERMRDFAYKYAVGCKHKRAYWAKKFGVEVCTVEKWLRHIGVRDYIKICQTKECKNIDYLGEIRGKLQRKAKATCRQIGIKC